MLTGHLQMAQLDSGWIWPALPGHGGLVVNEVRIRHLGVGPYIAQTIFHIPIFLHPYVLSKFRISGGLQP